MATFIPVTPNGIPGKDTGQRANAYYVSAAMLAPIVEQGIKALNDDEGIGGIEALGHAAGRMLGKTPEAVVRRMSDIRNLRTRTTNSELAGALCEESGADIGDLPIFPGGMSAAREMVACHFEFHDRENTPTLTEQETLAYQLLRFGVGFCADSELEAPGVEEFARTVASWRIREHEMKHRTTEDFSRGLELAVA